VGTAIRKHMRDFLAVAGLCAVALATVYVILQQQRLRIPILEQKPFQLKAEFETAQAVTPGQGQTVVVAGVKIGDISKVQLVDGKAVVTMDIERNFLPIYRNATALIRPRTGLQDVFIELDPGTKGPPNNPTGDFKDGDTIPLANTAPEVNLDQVLSALDGDTQAYLRTLIVGAGQGLKGRSKDLGRLLGGLGPINRELARLNSEVATRRHNLARLIHNLNLLTGTVGQHGDELAQLVDSSNAALGAIAKEDSHVQEAVRLLGPTLTTAHSTLVKTQPFAKLLGPTFNHLRPFARNLDRLNASVRRVSATKPVVRDEIRPFVRAARAPVRDLRPAAANLAKATPRLTDVATEINRLGNMATYNPGGANPPGSANRDEGYLYWLAWLNHDANSVFQAADGVGFWRRFIVTQNCSTALSVLASSPLAPVISGLAPLSQILSGNPAAPCS
jgi:phospholipid/cholesterol/gamma-HCH transport system substrate-binding protein